MTTPIRTFYIATSALCNSGYLWLVALALVVKVWVVGRSVGLDVADGILLGSLPGRDKGTDFARATDDLLWLPGEQRPYVVCRQ